MTPQAITLKLYTILGLEPKSAIIQGPRLDLFGMSVYNMETATFHSQRSAQPQIATAVRDSHKTVRCCQAFLPSPAVKKSGYPPVSLAGLKEFKVPRLMAIRIKVAKNFTFADAAFSTARQSLKNY